MADKIKFKIKNEKFGDFIHKLDDLTQIEDTIKLKIDSENILMYSMMGGNVMLAFKNFLINTSDYLEATTEWDFTLDIIISNAKKFVKNLQFLSSSEKVGIEVTYKTSQDSEEVMNARQIVVAGGKLKVNWLCAEHFEMRDINKVALKQRLDLKLRKWSFKISQSDFADVRKLSSINSDRIIHINVNGTKVSLQERAAWELQIDSIEIERNTNLMLNKKFLSCIGTKQEHIEFSIFETFMLIKDEDSNLMLSFEQDFSDD
jgi:hypothetical protein